MVTWTISTSPSTVPEITAENRCAAGGATVTLNSTGDAWLWVEESLNATLNSTGSVSYRGEPEVLARNTSTGRVRPIR